MGYAVFMRHHAEDRHMALLDDIAQAKKLGLSSIFRLISGRFDGGIFESDKLIKIGRDFDADKAGFDKIRERVVGKKHTISARCRDGIVELPGRKINGWLQAAQNANEQDYLRGVFQNFADIVAPVFGRDYKIRLEDRSNRYDFHCDEGHMVATLGLDEPMTPTLWQTKAGRVFSPPNGALLVITPKLLHSSPESTNRPVLSAARPMP